MAISNKRLTTTNVETVFTSQGNTAITNVIVCNTGARDLVDENINAADITVYLVPAGQTASDATTIVKDLTVPAGETVFFSDERVVLGQFDSIQATANVANLITITVSTLAL